MADLSGGGVETMRLRLVAEFVRRGYDVTLILQQRLGALRDQVPDGVRLVVLGHHRLTRCVLPLARLLRSRQPDVLISSLDHNNIVAITANILAGRCSRVIICQHNALSAEAVLGWKYRVVPFFYWALSRWADGIVAVSHGVAQDLAQAACIPRKRITVIMNPVIDADFVARARATAAHPWLLDRSVPVFIFVGRLTAQKDPALLLRAFARRRGQGPARLILLGDGPLRADLQAQAEALGISDSVLFAGFAANPLPWIAAAAALVLPSRYEGFGNVIVEALGCGIPVIATDCPHGPAEILGGGQFGLLVPVGDTAALADAMAEDLSARFPPPLCRARAAAFSVEASVDAHIRLFDRVSQPARRAVFGLRLCDLTAEQVADRMISVRQAGAVALVVTPNIDHLRHLRLPAFARAYAGASLVCADGFPIALYAAIRSAASARRVTGCAIVHQLFAHPRLRAVRVAALVESHATHQALAAWADRHGVTDQWCILVAPPELSRDDAAAARLADAIGGFAPHILIMGLGAPVSEVFVDRHAPRLPPCWALCAGQALRIELKLTRQAPGLLRAAGFEWAWRMWQEPGRLIPRYTKAALWFPVAIAADLLGSRRSAG